MRVGEMGAQSKSPEIYAPQLGRTPNEVPILRNSNAGGPRDEKPPLTSPEQRPRGVRKLPRMHQFPDYSSRQTSTYGPQTVPQRPREARVSQAQYPPAGPPSTRQRYGQYQRVPQQQAQAGIYSSLGTPRTAVTELVNGVWVTTRGVDESPYELVDSMPQLAHFCSSPPPQGSPPEVVERLPESKGLAPGRFLESAEVGPRAFEAMTFPLHFTGEWDPLRGYYSVAGSGEAMISGEEDETMAGSGEVVEMAGLNSFKGIA